MGLIYESTAGLPTAGTTVNIVGLVAAAVVEGEWAPARITRELRRNDVNGDLADRQLRAEPTAFTATIQCPNASVADPGMGNVVIESATNYIITAVKPRVAQGGYKLWELGLLSETLPTA